MRQTLPTISPAEARAVLERLRRRGWTEAEIAQRILPYLPPLPSAARAGEDARPETQPAIALPPRVSTAWLDGHLPSMDRREIRLVVDELERRGWPVGQVAEAVLPHLLGKLPPADASAILAGLRELGMTDEDIARLQPGG